MENDELNLDGLEMQVEEKLKVKNRFEKLSEKVITVGKEKDAEIEARKRVENERDSLSKERDFFRDFSKNVTKYPSATDYQDKILEKVRGGYSTEDAMVSVLAKEGKLNASAPAVQNQQSHNISVEGGSAPTNFEGTKSIKDMTVAEKLAALSDADKSGDLVSALRA